VNAFSAKINRALRHGLLVAITLAVLFPVVYIFATSFKEKGDVLTAPPTLWPATWTLDSYKQVVGSNMLRYYLPNTFLNALLASVLTVPLAAMAGYSLSRRGIAIARYVQVGLLCLMAIPTLTNLIPLYRIASTLRLLDTHFAIIAFYLASGLPFSIWILKSFFDSIPREIDEAALVDGASLMRVLWHVGLLDFQSQFGTAYHVQAAACVLISLPPIAVFIFMHKAFLRSILEGALRE